MKLLVTHGFRLKGPLFVDSEYGLGLRSGYGLEGEGVGREEIGREQRLVELREASQVGGRG